MLEDCCFQASGLSILPYLKPLSLLFSLLQVRMDFHVEATHLPLELS